MKTVIIRSTSLMEDWVERFEELPFKGIMYLSDYSPFELGMDDNWNQAILDWNTWYVYAGMYTVPVNPNKTPIMLDVINRLGYDDVDLWFVPEKDELYFKFVPRCAKMGNVEIQAMKRVPFWKRKKVRKWR